MTRPVEPPPKRRKAAVVAGTSATPSGGAPGGVDLTPPEIAAALRAGHCPHDHVFDRYLPDEILRVVSGQHWTPLAVVARAAKWLEELHVRTIVDIGSGAGKFCVAAALCGQFELMGIEQRSSLVVAARTLARAFEVEDRVTFVEAAIGEDEIPIADAYYLYNPFGENIFDELDHLDDEVELGQARYARDISIVEDWLRRAPPGTAVLALNGFGGQVPRSYRSVRVDYDVPGGLTLWRKDMR